MLARVIRTFSPGEKPAFDLEDTIHTFEGMAPREFYDDPIQWDAIATHYQLQEKMGDWNFQKGSKEKVLNITNPEALKAGGTLKGNWVTLYDIFASRNGEVDGNAFNSIGTSGITATKDNHLVIGIRGGEHTPERVRKVGVGLYGSAPGGATSFEQSYEVDPITDTLIKEFKEELGGFDVINAYPIGVYEAFLPGPTGIKVAGVVETDATFKQLKEINTVANIHHTDLTTNGVPRGVVENYLRKIGLPPDAWEHSRLQEIPPDVKSIENFLAQKEEHFTGGGAGALMTYLEFLSFR